MIVVATREESQAALAKLRDTEGAAIDWERDEARISDVVILVSRACPRRIPGIRAKTVEGTCAEHRRAATECYAKSPSDALNDCGGT